MEQSFDMQQRLGLWFAALSPDQQADPLAVAGELPSWMVDSLNASEIVMLSVTAEMTEPDGSIRKVSLMLGVVADFLERERALIPTAPQP